MADFDPSTYLAQVKAAPGPAFDPNQYLSQVGSPSVKPDAAGKAAAPKQEYRPPAGIATPELRAKFVGEHTPIISPISGLTAGADKLTQFLANSPVGRTLTNSAFGGLQGAMEKPKGDETRLGNAGLGALKSGLVTAGGEAVTAAGSKIADYLMQKAVGLKKYMPGMGNILIDEGVVGTKGRMANQTASKFDQAESELQDLAKGITEKVPSSDLADAVAKRGSKFQLPSGEIPPNMASEMAKVSKAEEGLRGLGNGELSAQDLIALKRQGDHLGYTSSGNPATSLDADLGRTQATAARKGLFDISDGQTADVLKREQALVLAKQALNKPDSLHGNPITSLLFGKIPGTSLLGSAGAQATQKLTAPISKLITPLMLESILSKQNEQ